MDNHLAEVKSPVKPFSVIFLIELWERFGYYGVQALLVMFLSEVNELF